MATFIEQLHLVKDTATLVIRDVVKSKTVWPLAGEVWDKNTDELLESFVQGVPELTIDIDRANEICYPLGVYGTEHECFLSVVDEFGNQYDLDILDKLDTETLLVVAEWLKQAQGDSQEMPPISTPKGIELQLLGLDFDLKYNDIEVSPVREVKGAFEVCEEGEESLWSVYLHMVEGGVTCVADCETKQQAVDLGKLLELCLKQPSNA